MPCFFPSAPHSEAAPPPPPPVSSSNPNLTTCLYHTPLGLTSLTWSKTIFGRSLHADLHFQDHDQNLSSSSFRLHLKPFLFWRKHGVKKFHCSSNSQSVVHLYWDLSRAKFSSIPEPQSGFYVALVVDGEMILVVGDLSKEAYERTKATKMVGIQSLISRKEHVTGKKVITTRASIGGKVRDISIDCSVGDEPKLTFRVDSEKVLVVKRLKWKFRGNEKIEVDGVAIQASWDVYNWFFEDGNDGHACFMFRFEEMEFEAIGPELSMKKNGEVNSYLGINGFETRKFNGNSFKTISSSSSSISSASSGSSSSIMEWACQEEDELQSQFGFSLVVYAWRS